MENQPRNKIRPVVIYPFLQPREIESLEVLFDMLSRLQSDDRFSVPITIVNNQTFYRSSSPRSRDQRVTEAYEAAQEIAKNVSKVEITWSVDTCAMWLRGLGLAFEEARKENAIHDVFWLLPGDFNYATEEGKAAVNKLHEIPLKVYNGECEICLGEINVPLNSSKQLIDTYGTYGLLYNWFPAEAQGIREVTDKPRTEFFALNYPTLEQALIENRWYAYEQTLMILLQNMRGKSPVRGIRRVQLGLISDEESIRSTLSSAMQQVERTERALKLFWRDRAEREANINWHSEFRVLDGQSENIRAAAMVILRRLLA